MSKKYFAWTKSCMSYNFGKVDRIYIFDTEQMRDEWLKGYSAGCYRLSTTGAELKSYAKRFLKGYTLSASYTTKTNTFHLATLDDYGSISYTDRITNKLCFV